MVMKMVNEQLKKQILKDVVECLTQDNEDMVLAHIDVVPCAEVIDAAIDFVHETQENH